MPDIVNPQITDAVTQTNVGTLAGAPSQAMGAFFQATGSALALAAQNATAAQQNAGATLQATTTTGVTLLYGVDTAATAVGISEILSVNKPAYGR